MPLRSFYQRLNESHVRYKYALKWRMRLFRTLGQAWQSWWGDRRGCAKPGRLVLAVFEAEHRAGDDSDLGDPGCNPEAFYGESMD